MNAFLALFIVLTMCPLAHADEARTNRAIKAVKDLCLTGTQFDFKADANGNLTFTKLTPGATGSVSVNVRQSEGAAAIIDDKIRQIADENIRTCIKPFIQRIVDSILDEPVAQTEVEVSWRAQYPLAGPPNQVECSCLSTTGTGTDSLPVPVDAKLRLENKCRGEVTVLGSKDTSPIPPGSPFRTVEGRFWTYFKLLPAQKATIEVGRSVGGGMTVTKCSA